MLLQGAFVSAQSADSLIKITYCTSKVLSASPSKLVTLSFDIQGPYDFTSDSLQGGLYNGANASSQTTMFGGSGGMRFFTNIPVIVKDKIIWQVGTNFWRNKYYGSTTETFFDPINPVNQTLATHGLTTMGLHTTVFKPWNSELFSIGQAAADMSGDYKLSDIPSLKKLKYSASFLMGKKAHSRMLFAAGISRSYRAGQVAYFPIALFLWTAPSEKWGVELLLPAKGAVRWNINKSNLLMLGYELEGQSYTLFNQNDHNQGTRNLELRRSEWRVRMTYEKQLYKLLWCSVQAGYRINNRFDVDEFVDNKEIQRILGNDTPYEMENKLSSAVYALFSIHLVAP
jgi:hypothetical protein